VARDTIDIRFVAPTEFDLGPDLRLCPGALHRFDLPSGMHYRWENGSADSSRTIMTAGTYILTIIDSNACVKSDTIRVAYLAAPAPALGPDMEICSGQSARLSAGSGFASYRWSTGSTASAIEVAEAGSYVVRVTSEEGCAGYDTIGVVVYPAPAVRLGRDTSICTGCRLSLDAGAGFTTYLWSTGERTRSISVADSGVYHVIVVDAHGCSGSDTIDVGLSGVTDVAEPATERSFDIRARPNPFGSEVTIGIMLKRRSAVRAELFDPSGRSIATIIDAELDGGEHEFRFDAERAGAASGVYLLRVAVDGVVSDQSIVRR
jgi:hypothetical protein